jgi:hypothetical protein
MATNPLLSVAGMPPNLPKPIVPPTSTIPGTTDTWNTLNTIIPGLTNLTKSGSDVISNMLQGLPSPSQTKTSNAYFGIGSGVPGSDFIRNRGYDLYNQQAQQRQQTGLQDLSGFLGTYSNLVPSPGQNLSTSLGYAQLGQSADEFNAQQAFNQWLQSQRLGLDWANTASRF